MLFPDGVPVYGERPFIIRYLKERPNMEYCGGQEHFKNPDLRWITDVHPYHTETKVLEMGVETFDMNGQKIKIYEKSV